MDCLPNRKEISGPDFKLEFFAVLNGASALVHGRPLTVAFYGPGLAHPFLLDEWDQTVGKAMVVPFKFSLIFFLFWGNQGLIFS